MVGLSDTAGYFGDTQPHAITHCFCCSLFLKDGSWAALGLPVAWLCCDSQASTGHLENCFHFPHIFRGSLCVSPLCVLMRVTQGVRAQNEVLGSTGAYLLAPNLPWRLSASLPLHPSCLTHLSCLRWQQLCLCKSPETVLKEKWTKDTEHFLWKTHKSARKIHKRTDHIVYQRMLNHQK